MLRKTSEVESFSATAAVPPVEPVEVSAHKLGCCSKVRIAGAGVVGVYAPTAGGIYL